MWVDVYMETKKNKVLLRVWRRRKEGRFGGCGIRDEQRNRAEKRNIIIYIFVSAEVY